MSLVQDMLKAAMDRNRRLRPEDGIVPFMWRCPWTVYDEDGHTGPDHESVTPSADMQWRMHVATHLHLGTAEFRDIVVKSVQVAMIDALEVTTGDRRPTTVFRHGTRVFGDGFEISIVALGPYGDPLGQFERWRYVKDYLKTLEPHVLETLDIAIVALDHVVQTRLVEHHMNRKIQERRLAWEYTQFPKATFYGKRERALGIV